MKKAIFILCGLLLIGSLTGCMAEGNGSSSHIPSSGSSQPEGIHIPEGALRVDSLGIAMVLPQSMAEQVGSTLLTSAAGDCVRSEVQIYGQLFLLYQSQEVYDRLMELSRLGQELSNEEYAVMSKQVKRVCAVTSLHGPSLDEFLTGNDDLSAVTGFENNESLGSVGDYRFYFSWDNEDSSSLSESSLKQYREILSLLPQVQEQVICYLPTVSSQG